MNILKLSLLSTLIFQLNFNSFGQTTGQEHNPFGKKPSELHAGSGQAAKQKYKASMNGWEVNLETAQAISIKTGKPILANFTGTDWCGWCIRLKKEVFVKDEFIKWANENFVLLELDFPKRFALPANIKEQNQQLAQAFGVRGYPTIWAFTISTNEETGKSEIKGLAKTGYVAGGPKSWIKDFEGKLAANKVKTPE
ncbi:thioredoxin family protein [Flavobacteriales bacterium]|nr:thioredoxin family protein [Flavobacteriales bacterium]